MKSGLKIGVLAVQGAFIEHKRMLESLGCECVELRKKSDICDIDGLVLPGGESTVQGKLLRELDMFDELKGRIANGLPVLATCAGLILLASHISNDDNVYFGTLPVTVKRNAYGRQLGSFEATARFDNSFDFTMTFIRAWKLLTTPPKMMYMCSPSMTAKLSACSIRTRLGWLFIRSLMMIHGFMRGFWR